MFFFLLWFFFQWTRISFPLLVHLFLPSSWWWWLYQVRNVCRIACVCVSNGFWKVGQPEKWMKKPNPFFCCCYLQQQQEQQQKIKDNNQSQFYKSMFFILGWYKICHPHLIFVVVLFFASISGFVQSTISTHHLKNKKTYNPNTYITRKKKIF